AGAPRGPLTRASVAEGPAVVRGAGRLTWSSHPRSRAAAGNGLGSASSTGRAGFAARADSGELGGALAAAVCDRVFRVDAPGRCGCGRVRSRWTSGTASTRLGLAAGGRG